MNSQVSEVSSRGFPLEISWFEMFWNGNVLLQNDRKSVNFFCSNFVKTKCKCKAYEYETALFKPLASLDGCSDQFWLNSYTRRVTFQTESFSVRWSCSDAFECGASKVLTVNCYLLDEHRGSRSMRRGSWSLDEHENSNRKIERRTLTKNPEKLGREYLTEELVAYRWRHRAFSRTQFWFVLELPEWTSRLPAEALSLSWNFP